MLLSGLVYPGLGQLLLGHRPSGIFFILGTSAAFVVLIYRLMQRVFRVMNEAVSRLTYNALDVQTLKELLEQTSAGGWRVENLCLIGIFGLWLAAIVHAYFVGKKIDSHP